MRRLALLVLLFLVAASPLTAQIVLAPITRATSFQPVKVAVYETGNKVFVADAVTNSVFMFDGDTNAELASAAVEGDATDMVVHEGSGKVYVVQNATNKVAVINAATGEFLHFLTGTYSRTMDASCKFAVDESFGKVWIRSTEGIGQIDVATDTVTLVQGGVNGVDIAVNPVTHELFAVNYAASTLYAINGTTLAATPLGNYPGFGVTVNWQENKVYVLQGVNAHIVAYDRDTGTSTVAVQNNDALLAAYDPVRNRIITDSEVNAYSSLIEANDTSFNLPMEGGTGALAVRNSTGHVYYVGDTHTTIVDEETHTFVRMPVPGAAPAGISSFHIAINQITGRAYIIHQSTLGFVTVMQDTAAISHPPIFIGSTPAAPVLLFDPEAHELVETYAESGGAVYVRPGGGRLYSLGWGSGLLGSIGISEGTGSNELINSIYPVGDSLGGLAISPDGSRLFATSYSPITPTAPGSVYVIDAATRATITTIAVGGTPLGIALTPNGQKAIVTNFASNSVSIISTATNTVTATFLVGIEPTEVVVHPAGRKAYVADSWYLSVVDLTTNSVPKTIALSQPTSLALTPDGRQLYIVEPGQVTVVDTATDAVVGTIPITNGSTRSITAGPDGTTMFVLASSVTQSWVIGINTTTRATTTWELPLVTSADMYTIAATDVTARFAGRVSRSGSGVSGIAVRVLQGGVERGSSTTNSSGEYVIANLLAGAYDVEMSSNGTVVFSSTAEVAYSGRVTLRDAALPPCSFEVTPRFADYGSQAGNGTISVSTSPGCSWTTGGSSFVTVGAGATGTGSASYTVAENGSATARSTTITVAGVSVTITQAAAGLPVPVLTATGGASTVSLTWSAVSGATSYQLLRSSGSGFGELTTTTSLLSFTDANVTPGTGYVYRVVAYGGAGTIAYSNVDLAVVFNYTDTITAQLTTIRAVHLDELRHAVNAARAATGLSQLTFTDEAVPGVPVKRVHLLELRNGASSARSAVGLPAFGFTDSTITTQATPIRAQHWMELRSALQ